MFPLKEALNLSSKPPHQKWLLDFDFEAPNSRWVEVRDLVAQLGLGIDWTFTFKPSKRVLETFRGPKP